MLGNVNVCTLGIELRGGVGLGGLGWKEARELGINSQNYSRVLHFVFGEPLTEIIILVKHFWNILSRGTNI